MRRRGSPSCKAVVIMCLCFIAISMYTSDSLFSSDNEHVLASSEVHQQFELVSGANDNNADIDVAFSSTGTNDDNVTVLAVNANVYMSVMYIYNQSVELLSHIKDGDAGSKGGIYKDQAILYASIALPVIQARNGKVVVCETGFFRGASASLWLSLSPDTVLYSFDVDRNRAVDKLLEIVGPDRFFFTQGSSPTTIPDALDDHTCDIIVVDGDHGKNGALKDLQAFEKKGRISSSSLVIADDTFDCLHLSNPCDVCTRGCDCDQRGFCNSCSESWATAVSEGILQTHFCIDLGLHVLTEGGYPKGFCVGRMMH